MAADGGRLAAAAATGDDLAKDAEFCRQWAAVMHHNHCSSDERHEGWHLAAEDPANARRSYAALYAEIAWMRTLPDADVLQMMPNPNADALEPWRLECEARYVMRMPTKAARQDWIARVAKKRGEAEAARLQAEVMRLWARK
jgi:hypothetical protein